MAEIKWMKVEGFSKDSRVWYNSWIGAFRLYLKPVATTWKSELKKGQLEWNISLLDGIGTVMEGLLVAESTEDAQKQGLQLIFDSIPERVANYFKQIEKLQTLRTLLTPEVGETNAS